MDWFDFMDWTDRNKPDARVDPARATDTRQPADAPQYDPAEVGRSLSDTLSRYAMRDLVRETGVPRQTLYDIINGARPTRETYERMQPGLARLKQARRDIPAYLRAQPLGRPRRTSTH